MNKIDDDDDDEEGEDDWDEEELEEDDDDDDDDNHDDNNDDYDYDSSKSTMAKAAEDESPQPTSFRSPKPVAAEHLKNQNQTQDIPVRIIPKDEETAAFIRRALKRSTFFSYMDEQQVNRFVEYAQLKTFSAGDMIILEGCLDTVGNDSDLSDNLLLEGGGDDDSQSYDESSIQSRLKRNARGKSASNDNNDVRVKERDELLEFKVAKGEQNLKFEPKSKNNQGDDYLHNKNQDQEDDANTLIDEQQMPQAEKIDRDSVLDEADRSVLSQSTNSTADLNVDTPQEYTTEDGMFWTNRGQNQQLSPPPSTLLEPPRPPSSGIQSYLYIIRKGQVDVVLGGRTSPASLGPGTVFGEGGFLFGRQHSASVVAVPTGGTVECWVVDVNTFRHLILPSDYLTQLYQQYATHYDEKKGKKYMTLQDFVQSCLHYPNELDEEETSSHGGRPRLEKPQMINDPMACTRIASTFQILQNQNQRYSTSSDSNKRLLSQRISLADFCLFHLLMARPDPEVDVLFALIDVRKRGVLYKEDVDNFLRSSLDKDFQFDMNSEFIHRHFGDDKNDSTIPQQRCIRSNHFPQFLVDLRREIGQQAFLQELKRSGTPEGYLAPNDFVRILKTACGWQLPDGLADRVECVYCKNSIQQSGEALYLMSSGTETRQDGYRSYQFGDHYFSYCDFLAFQEVLGQLPGICNLIDRACEIKNGPVSIDDFKVINHALGSGRLSRQQVDIIFQLFDLDKDGLVSYNDTVCVAGIEIAQRIDVVAGHEGKLTFGPPSKYGHRSDDVAAHRMVIENFSLAAIASTVGVVAMYPLDLCKTRVMNQRTGVSGQLMYRHSLDCLKQAFRCEGLLGLYRGLTPQMLGFGPEKAIKMAVYDLVRDALDLTDTSPDSQKLNLCLDLISGGCAGACQLLVTNPAEILKIRLQLQGETARVLQSKGFGNPVPQSLTKIAKTLGYSGLFTGARACLLRDIPFSAIYFPTYSCCKGAWVNREGHSAGSVQAASLLFAGTLAGVPAALLTTPADVIKTRLQTIPRPGESSYNGIRDCFTKVYEKEGPGAFFKGSALRVARLSPQFGIAALVYEHVSQLDGFRGLRRSTNASVKRPPGNFWARAIGKKPDDADTLLRSLGSNSLKPSTPEYPKK